MEKQFLKCTRNHLAAAGTYGLIYDVADLALCYDGLDAIKIAKKCIGVPGAGIQKEVQKCAGAVDDRSLSALFPGCDADDVATTSVCMGRSARCRLCQSANAAVDANRDCDLFDDGLDNESCELCSISTGYPSTMAALQAIIFDSPTYGCTSNLCHGSVAPQGGLDLTDDPNTPAIESYANLVNVAGNGASPALDRVEPGEPALSFLYTKLAAGTFGSDPGGGSPMPSGGAPALTEEHLEGCGSGFAVARPRTSPSMARRSCSGAVSPSPIR
jgi:hypothetical protein